MSCAPAGPTFRLLDPYVGWDESTATGLTGLDDPAGLRLARVGPAPGGPDRQDLLPWFPDPRLASGFQRCSWYLIAESGLLHRDPCGDGWTPQLTPSLPLAVAAAGHWLAVADEDRVRVWWREGDLLVTDLRFEAPSRIAVTVDGSVYVAGAAGTDLWHFRPGGAPAPHFQAGGGEPAPEAGAGGEPAPCGRLRTGLPGRVEGIRVDRNRRVWLLTEDDAGPHVWRSGRDGRQFRAATLAELAEALPPSTLVSTWDGGFCLRERDPDGDDVDTCFAWSGEPVAGRPPAPAPLVAEGELLTVAVDSGLSRCRWHRVVVDADVPPGTAVRVAVTVTEEPAEPPDPGDWQEAGLAWPELRGSQAHSSPRARGALEFLVDQPPGRYLYLRMRLTGDGTDTPVVRRVRLDFPRATSADLLPAAFREDPAADDFTERFLSLFDTSLAGMDRVIERYPALLDPHGVPDEAVAWLGGLLGLAFEAGWEAGTRRALLVAAPELYRRRGTPWAVREVVRIVFGVEPVIEELAGERRWLRIGTSGRLGQARLFGRSAARLRVGSSALSTAPLRSGGDPYGDPLGEHAYRFRVSLPPREVRPADEPALRRLVRSQAPAHTAATIRLGGLGFVVGTWSAVGIDTAFVALPDPVLGPAGPDGVPDGGRPVRLGRHSVLASSRRGPHRGMAVGERTAVGVESVSW